jgi:uncharacterized membrane protein YqaE (UPF0057 family)
LYGPFTLPYTPNIVHAAFSVERVPATRITPPVVDLDENSYISFLIETFRGLIAPFTLFYTPNVVHAAYSVGARPGIHKTQSFADFDKNSDISSLIETFQV